MNVRYRPGWGAAAACVMCIGMLLGGCEDEVDVQTNPVSVNEPVTETAGGEIDPSTQVYGMAREDDRAEDAAENPGAMIFPAGAAEGVLKVVRSGQETVRVGQPYEYAITVTNLTEHPVHGVTLLETVPASFQIDEAQPRPQTIPAKQHSAQGRPQQQQQGAQVQQTSQRQNNQRPRIELESDQPQPQNQGEAQQQQKKQPSREPSAVHRWALGTLMPGETRDVRVRGIPLGEGMLTSCIVVDYEPSLCTFVKVVKPELQVRRTIVNSEGEPVENYYACQEIFAIYQVSNTGSGTTSGVRVSEDFPDWLVTAEGGGDVNFTLDPLEAGETAEQRVQLRAEGTGQYSGRAIAAAQDLQVQSGKAQVAVYKAQLELAVNGPRREYINRPIRYEATVTNTSSVAALETVLAIEAAEGARNMTVTGGELDGDSEHVLIGRLEPGESRTIGVTFTGGGPGQLATQFTAGAYCAQETTQRFQTALMGIPAIRLEVVDLKDPVQAGETTMYEIRVTNQGTAEDLDVRLSAQLPQQLAFVGGEGDTRVGGQGQQVNFEPIPRLAPGDTVSWRIETRAQDTGRVRFQLQMTSDANPQQVIEMEPTTIY